MDALRAIGVTVPLAALAGLLAAGALGLLALAWALWQTHATGAGRRACGRPLRRGDPLPFFMALALDGRPVPSAALFAEGRDMLLLFVGPDSAPCRALLEALLPRRGHPDKLVVIADGRLDARLAQLGQLAGHEVLLQQDGAASRRCGVAVMPCALKVRRDGIVVAPPVVGRDAILGLAGPPHGRGPRRPRVSVLP
ncbi:hypothetical protein IP91_04541 [Pseudoduganella lurida]|uniref:Uncharacterized protein n=1 Tax=Pseudoduganella lurida TaxID=1036180 RepID=A0A562QX97_9BURK|nr:hypothetical protein [Pseudoduganella lurida]TWI61461.1 hypothetical protein IP91_04541 [Pseudoduganella lurida]